MKMTLKRNSSNFFGTKGEFLIDGVHQCYVLEPKDPILPVGEYVLNRYFSNHNGFEVLKYESSTDPNFSNKEVEIHPGNTYHDTLGCSLPGTRYGKLDFRNDLQHPERESWGVVDGILNSCEAFYDLMSKVPNGTIITVLGIGT
jgi:hypothetical protein